MYATFAATGFASPHVLQLDFALICGIARGHACIFRLWLKQFRNHPKNNLERTQNPIWKSRTIFQIVSSRTNLHTTHSNLRKISSYWKGVWLVIYVKANIIIVITLAHPAVRHTARSLDDVKSWMHQCATREYFGFLIPCDYAFNHYDIAWRRPHRIV